LMQVSEPEMELSEKMEKHASYGNDLPQQRHLQFAEPEAEVFVVEPFVYLTETESDVIEGENVCMPVTYVKLAGPGRAQRGLFHCDCEIHQNQPQELFPQPQHLFQCDCRYCVLADQLETPEEVPYSIPPIKRRATKIKAVVADLFDALEEVVQSAAEDGEDDEREQSEANAAALGVTDSSDDGPVPGIYASLMGGMPVTSDSDPNSNVLKSLKEGETVEVVDVFETANRIRGRLADGGFVSLQTTDSALQLFELVEALPFRANAPQVETVWNKKWSASEFQTLGMEKLQRSKRVDDAWAKSKSLVSQPREPTPDQDDEGWVPCVPNLRMWNLPEFDFNFAEAAADEKFARMSDEKVKKEVLYGWKRQTRWRIKDWFSTMGFRMGRDDHIGVSLRKDRWDHNRYYMHAAWVTFESTDRGFEYAFRCVNAKKEDKPLIFNDNVVDFSWAYQKKKR